MSTVYVYLVDGKIIGISASPQNAMNGIEWVEREADDPGVLQWMVDHGIRAPFSSETTENI